MYLRSLAGLIAAVLTWTAGAQTKLTDTPQPYPSKPIHLLVGFPPGGNSDFVARALGRGLAESWGQSVIVDNRPGAGGNIAADLVAKAAADGHTLLLAVFAHAVNPSLYRSLPFDPMKDFAPVILCTSAANILVVHPSLPATSVKTLIALAKARPGQIVYGSSGQGAIVHLTTELFLYMAGVQMTHVPYKGGGPAMTDLIAGQIQLVFATSQVGLPQAKAGRLRALAVTTPERIAAEPQLPTVTESGLPGYEVTNWHALIGPKAIPRAIVERLNAEMTKILGQKDMAERLQGDGVSPAGGTPEQLFAQIRKEIEQWRQVVTRAGIKIN